MTKTGDKVEYNGRRAKVVLHETRTTLLEFPGGSRKWVREASVVPVKGSARARPHARRVRR